jgi:hypothetical protein
VNADRSYEPDMGAIRRDVGELSALRRSSARSGERSSAAWLASRLESLGVAGVEVQPFPYQATYASAHALHNSAGLLACRLGGIRAAALALATLVSYELEVSGRSQWCRRLLPAGGGANVVARIPARSERRPRMTLVLVAHHDAANTGLIWHSRLVSAGAARHRRRRRIDPFMAPIELALALAAAGGLAAAGPRRGTRRARTALYARTAAAVVLVLASTVEADVVRSPTVPGASDNATGVAVCLDLARHLIRRPLPDLDVWIVLPGCEEAGMGGMRAFLDRYDEALDPACTFVLGLDTLGAGLPIVLSGEGAMREQRYREPDILLVEEGAALAAEPAPSRWRLGGWTDPILAVHRGLPTASLLSMGPGYLPNYHVPTDTPENVDWESVDRCARIAAGTIAAFARRTASIHLDGSQRATAR